MLFSFEPISYSCEGKAQSTTLTESMVLSLWIPGGFVWDTHKEKTSWFPWERIPVRVTSSGSLPLPSSHPRLSYALSASDAYWFQLSTYLSLQKTLPHCISEKLIYRLKFLIWENKTAMAPGHTRTHYPSWPLQYCHENATSTLHFGDMWFCFLITQIIHNCYYIIWK